MTAEGFWGKKEVVGAYLLDKKLFRAEEYLLGKYFKEGMSVLNLGCGTGRVAEKISDKVGFIKGIDIDELMLDAFSERMPHAETECRSMESLDEEPNRYDLVMIPYNSLDYLEPKEKRTLALQSVYNCLKPGGLLIFSSHNPLGDIVGWTYSWRPGTLCSIAGRMLRGYSWREESYVSERLFSSKVSTYYGRDKRVITDVEFLGFSFLEARGAKFDFATPLFYRYMEFWIYYVFEKPLP